VFLDLKQLCTVNITNSGACNEKWKTYRMKLFNVVVERRLSYRYELFGVLVAVTSIVICAGKK
jgi:hypothetical protein